MVQTLISASRSTDVLAFYAQWFINRLRAGYCVWYDPVNQKPMYIFYKKIHSGESESIIE
ncbi:MAG: DUF1848 family protein [Paludibacteraceae bacterium]|nr:DUF1848 family protein [Paludibacteraceae bacterium]